MDYENRTQKVEVSLYIVFIYFLHNIHFYDCVDSPNDPERTERALHHSFATDKQGQGNFILYL